MKKAFLILVFVSLVFSFAAQAEVVVTTRWPLREGYIVPIDISGIAAGSFDEATQKVYAAVSNNEDSVRDYVIVSFDSEILELSAPTKLKATYTYNVPPGGIAGQVDAAMHMIQYRPAGESSAAAGVEITEPVAGSSTVKYVKLTGSSGDQTNSVISKNIMPAGRYYATFRFEVPGYTGWPAGRLVRADALNGAKMISIKLETSAPALKIRR